MERGTTPAQRVVTGPLAELPALAAAAGVRSPAVVVVGEVARLHGQLDWYAAGGGAVHRRGSAMRMKNYFQVSLDVEDRPCLMVGGGPEAEEKSGRLLDAGARVTLVSPEATAQLASWADAGRLTLRRAATRTPIWTGSTSP